YFGQGPSDVIDRDSIGGPVIGAATRLLSTLVDKATKEIRIELVRLSWESLPQYVAALKRGWSADNVRGLEAVRDELAKIDADPQAFVDRLHDPDGKGPPVTLPDGSQVKRLPGYQLWMWDEVFCG